MAPPICVWLQWISGIWRQDFQATQCVWELAVRLQSVWLWLWTLPARSLSPLCPAARLPLPRCKLASRLHRRPGNNDRKPRDQISKRESVSAREKRRGTREKRLDEKLPPLPWAAAQAEPLPGGGGRGEARDGTGRRSRGKPVKHLSRARGKSQTRTLPVTPVTFTVLGYKRETALMLWPKTKLN